MGKTVWINLEETQVDTSTLKKRLTDAGFDVRYRTVSADDTAGIIEQGRRADAVVSTAERWNEATLPQVSGSLKLIMRYGAGIDNVDLSAATDAGICVANVPGANSAAVAEVALLHILNLGRRFCQCVEKGRNNIWPVGITGNELDGKTVGIVGFGNIARQLVRLLSGFRVDILAYDPIVGPDESQYPVKAADSMEEVFSSSDIVSLHIPLNDSTREIVDQRLFDRMKEGAYFINTCRGGVVKEEDLIRALRSGRLRGAGLDVLACEPTGAENPLLTMDNVFITSHMGAESAESGYRSQNIMADTIIRFFKGEMPDNIKNKEVKRNG
ncbi:3-phosphoglycerate dehydrogenase [[Clostridium] symbiosum]|uniref:3-phosphoglycerate dehydrogenase n=1 Tax=Clostridium symbiosum TaxID=1512 RepID=A0AAW5F5R2_CLOSY|nr:NAD(P)-dependent oxidoreductase [[Clostridium] symbiosum]MCK0087208.1 3-phosphoglycerate dehydrogenase [[Clostridium] symbiosum]